MSQEGEILLHRNMQAAPDPFLTAIAPSRAGLVVAVACLFTWSWLADLCAAQGMPFVLGHALSLKAIHGGTATNDPIDSQKIAALLRGGMRPQAYVYPAERRATRALLRRRTHLRRTRAALLAPVHNTTSPYHLPEIGQKIAYKAHREGVADRLPEPAVQKNIDGDLARLTYDEKRLSDLERSILTTATPYDAHTLSLWHTGPGIGNILRLVLLYAIPASDRCPRGQDFASYGRLVKCAKASAGQRLGISSKQIGNAHLTGAFAEAAPLVLRNHEPGQKYLARLEKKHEKGKARTLLAHQWARAVYYRLKRKLACDMDLFLQTSGSRAGEPGASLATEGLSLHRACLRPGCRRL